MIKSKIEARERAWDEAVKIAFEKKTVTISTTDDIISSAEKIVKFFIGDAELPDVAVAPKGASKPHICHARPEQSKNIETRNHDYKK